MCMEFSRGFACTDYKEDNRQYEESKKANQGAEKNHGRCRTGLAHMVSSR